MSSELGGTGDLSAVEERRVKILSIDQQLFVDLFNWGRRPWVSLDRPIADEFPDDAWVVSVSANWRCGTLEAIVASKSFPVVPPGVMPEQLGQTVVEFWRVPVLDEE